MLFRHVVTVVLVTHFYNCKYFIFNYKIYIKLSLSPYNSPLVFLLKSSLWNYKVETGQEPRGTLELKMMKMTDCNSMLAASAKTLITSWQTLYWISMKRDTLCSLLSNKDTSNYYQCDGGLLICRPGCCAEIRSCFPIISVLNKWPGMRDESAAVVVKMIWPRYEMMTVSDCPSISSFKPALLWTSNIIMIMTAQVPHPAWSEDKNKSHQDIRWQRDL